MCVMSVCYRLSQSSFRSFLRLCSCISFRYNHNFQSSITLSFLQLSAFLLHYSILPSSTEDERGRLFCYEETYRNPKQPRLLMQSHYRLRLLHWSIRRPHHSSTLSYYHQSILFRPHHNYLQRSSYFVL